MSQYNPNMPRPFAPEIRDPGYTEAEIKAAAVEWDRDCGAINEVDQDRLIERLRQNRQRNR